MPMPFFTDDSQKMSTKRSCHCLVEIITEKSQYSLKSASTSSCMRQEKALNIS